MERVAVFVDAGYLYARGCDILGHPRTPRQHLTLDHTLFKKELDNFIKDKTESALLRIYWYDGLPPNGNMSSDQSRIALAEDFKLRLGQINGQGQQKGVDSMIVTDMIDLGRNRAISHAVLLGGDDDLRVGVEVTQTFGVRVHILGFGADPGQAAVNRFLRQEADSSSSWSAEKITGFLNVFTEASTPAGQSATISPINEERNTALLAVVDKMIAELDSQQIETILAHRTLSGKRSIPSDIDRYLLKKTSEVVGSVLQNEEKRAMRRHFNELIDHVTGRQTS